MSIAVLRGLCKCIIILHVCAIRLYEDTCIMLLYVSLYMCAFCQKFSLSMSSGEACHCCNVYHFSIVLLHADYVAGLACYVYSYCKLC